MIKILQFGKFYPPSMGGTQQVMFEISEGLSVSGYKCDVLCSNTKPVYEENDFNNYTVFRTASYGLILSTSITPQLIYKFLNIYKNYDIIHVHAADPIAFLALFLIRPKIKVVVHWHSDIIRQKKSLKFFLPLQNWVLNFADKVIVTSDNYAKHSLALKNFKNKINIVPIGISNQSLVSNIDNVKRIKKKYNNKKIIFALGRLVSYKGFDYLIESSKYLNDEFVILIGGTGIEEKFLQNIISINNLEKKVELIGYISENEKNDYLEACFLFCLPSITKAEAFGVVIVEAMSFSKPIVSTNMIESGISWVNENNITGIQVSPKSSKELANAFNKISNDDNLYKLMSKNSLQRYNKLFTRENMTKLLIKLYKSLGV
ncbi:MAG: glycosyltransferase [Campylobacterota bacterium]|nr:glycosyltransferase [Campylobacterota bacterium]